MRTLAEILASLAILANAVIYGTDVGRAAAHPSAGCARRRLPVARLLTHRLALDDVNAGFDRLASGEAGREVVLP